jgi:predicted esterase
VNELKNKPVFLFTAEDDDNVPTATVKQFAADLKKAGAQVELVSVKTGGHYDSMIKEGRPAAVKWLKMVDSRK